MLPGAKTFNLQEDLSPEEIIYQPFPTYSNPDRFALVSVYESERKGENKTFVKIHGLFPDQKMAENIGKAAVGAGYRSNCLVCDTRQWLQFPIEKVETEVHVNKELENIIGMEIKKDQVEYDNMRKRVIASRNEKPTTAFGRFENLVKQTAVDLLNSLEDQESKEVIDLKERFEKFKETEIANMPKHVMDEKLERHLRQKIRDASISDKGNMKKITGMGMPSM